MSGEVIDRDLGWEKILKEVGSYREAYTKVGIQGTEAAEEHKGISNVRLASLHEYGGTISHPGGTAYFIGDDGMAVFVSNDKATPEMARTKAHQITIPKRSFVRASIDANRSKHDGQSAKLAGRVLEGKMSFRQAMAILGRVISSGMQRFIKSGRVSPPLKTATVKRKKSSQPLVDTGQLVNSITHAEVVR